MFVGSIVVIFLIPFNIVMMKKSRALHVSLETTQKSEKFSQIYIMPKRKRTDNSGLRDRQ